MSHVTLWFFGVRMRIFGGADAARGRESVSGSFDGRHDVLGSYRQSFGGTWLIADTSAALGLTPVVALLGFIKSKHTRKG